MLRRVLLSACVASCLGVLGAPARAHAPHDLATAVALSPDFANDGLVFAQFHLIDQRVFGRSTDGGDTWGEVGFAMAEHVVQEFAFSPDFTGDGTAFAATDGGGVYRTRDRGLSWQRVVDGLGTLKVRDLAVSPAFASDGVVLLATSAGLWRTADEGDSWSEVLVGLEETAFNTVAFSPDDAAGARVYCGGKILHGSVDGGQSWSKLRVFADTLSEIACSLQHELDGRMALAFQTTGMLRSDSFGSGWQGWNGGLSEPRLLDVDVAADGTWFASGRDEGPFVADVFGGTWQLQTSGIEPWDETTQNHYREVRPSPAFASDDTVYVATTEGLYVSHDGGGTWTGQDIFNQRLHVRLLPSPEFASDGEVYTGNYGGGVYVWREPRPEVAPGALRGGGGGGGGGTQSAGAAGPVTSGPAPAATSPGASAPPGVGPALPGWQERASGIKSLWTDSLFVSPTFAVDHTLFQSYVGLHRSHDRGRSWESVGLPPGVVIVRDMVLSPGFASDGELFIGTNGVGTYRSTDGGDSWVDVSAGLPPGFRTRRLLLSPDYVADRTVVAASWDHGVWLSADAGATWSERNAGLAQLKIQSLAMSPDFHVDGTLLAGTKVLGVHLSTDFGQSWTQISESFALDDVFVSSGVAFSPEWSRDGTAFAVTLAGTIHRTTDFGQSWQRADEGFGWTGARDVIVSPGYARDRAVFVASHAGLWRSRDGGDSWQQLPDFVRVDDRHPNVEHEGAWSYFDAPGVNGRGVSASAEPGATRSLRFFGRSLAWHALRAADAGIADVHVDGVFAGQVDLYASADEPAVVFEADFPEAGWHEVRVTVTGTSSPLASDVIVTSDGFTHR